MYNAGLTKKHLDSRTPSDVFTEWKAAQTAYGVTDEWLTRFTPLYWCLVIEHGYPDLFSFACILHTEPAPTRRRGGDFPGLLPGVVYYLQCRAIGTAL